MRSLVVYFSQTGNTKMVAEAITRGVKSAAGNCRMVKLAAVKPDELRQYDLVGLGCPVFAFREPLNVRWFIDSLPSLSGKHCFLFATHGTILGGTFSSMAGPLRSKGLTIVGTFDCYASAPRQYLPSPSYTDGHPDEIDLKEAEDFGKDMADRSKRTGAGETGLVPDLAASGDTPFDVYPNLRPGRAVVEMKLNREKCTYPKCRLCIDYCPTRGIDMSAEPPVFRNPCISCYMCEKICPEGAIECDWEPVARRYLNRVRTVHQKAVEKAEAQGRFRRLAEADLDRFWYQVHDQHPRCRPAD